MKRDTLAAGEVDSDKDNWISSNLDGLQELPGGRFNPNGERRGQNVMPASRWSKPFDWYEVYGEQEKGKA